MRVLKRVVIGVAVLVSAVLSLFVLGEFGMCGVDIVAIVPSPDQRQRVVIYQHDCGATTDFSTQVTLNPLFASRPIGGGNIWSADAGHGVAPRAKWGGPDVRVDWTSPTSLRLLHHPRVRVFRAEKRVGGVSIAYGFLGEDHATPNTPLERPGMSASRPVEPADAGRSAPSR